MKDKDKEIRDQRKGKVRLGERVNSHRARTHRTRSGLSAQQTPPILWRVNRPARSREYLLERVTSSAVRFAASVYFYRITGVHIHVSRGTASGMGC